MEPLRTRCGLWWTRCWWFHPSNKLSITNIKVIVTVDMIRMMQTVSEKKKDLTQQLVHPGQGDQR